MTSAAVNRDSAGSAIGGRSAALDLLRAVAVVLVLGRHLGVAPVGSDPLLRSVSAAWFRGGWVGVDLFFVLSGFLVSGLLFREYLAHGSVKVGRFLLRRGLKLYPAFWVLLAVTLLGRTWLDLPIPQRRVFGELFFLQNYLGGLWNHTWSLAVEEHFYLLLALYTWLRTRKVEGPGAFDGLPRLFLLVAALCLALRLRVGAAMPYAHPTHLFPTHLRIDSLLFGVLLSYGWHFKGWSEAAPLRRAAPYLFLGGTLMLAPAFVFPLESTRWIPTFGLTLFYLGSGGLLLGALHGLASTGPVVRYAAAIGACSYSIYLWHMPVQQWLLPLVFRYLHRPVAWGEWATMYLLGSVLVGMVMAKAVEYPVLRIRDRIIPSRAPRAEPWVHVARD